MNDSSDAIGDSSPLGTDPATHVKRSWLDQGARIRREAGLIADSSHPGVVELVRVLDDSAACEIHLAHVAGTSLQECEPLHLDRLMRVLASAGRTLDDLHRRGIRHGSVRADHVLIDDRGRTVLCGFGDAGRDGEELAPAVSDDTHAFARMGLAALARSEAAGVIDSEERTAWALRALLEQAAGADATADLSLEPYLQRLDRLSNRDLTTGRNWPMARWQRRAAAVVVVAVGAATLWLFRPDGSSIAEVAPATGPPLPSTTVAPPVSTSAPALSLDETVSAVDTSGSVELVQPVGQPQPPSPPGGCAAPPPRPTLTSAHHADVDGDGCIDAVAVQSGRLSAVGQVWQLGDPADLVAIGDWTCDGTATAALLRITTGDVFVFAEWPGPRSPATVEALERVEGATSIRAQRAPAATCDVLILETPMGDRIIDTRIEGSP